MEKLTCVIPESLKHLLTEHGVYYQLGKNVYITNNEGVIISVIDSAIDETLVIYWSEEDQYYYHYTNCFGLGGGDAAGTLLAIKEWCEEHGDNIVGTA